MSSMFGSCLKLSLFGQSHGAGIGIVLDGFPAGMLIDMDRLMAEMNRRRPGQNRMTTQRQEADAPEFISGVLNGRTTGQPICAVIRNTGMHSADYGDGVDVLRPAHADYTGHVRYFGWEDWRGGGSFSGRLTAPIVLAGALCSQYLEEQNICLASEFEAACNRTDYDFDYYGQINHRSDREFLLEGYLWPDTYDIIPENGAEGIVRRMLREFERKWEKHVLWKQQAQEMGLTVDQVITMASCIEREAMLAEEAPKVARVLFNRNEEGLFWGLNCTILYALQKEGTGDDFVSYSDLEVESKYNTYKYSGFPVGPISNPGQTSIEAVLQPAEGDWLYFIGFEDGSGEHLFTSDYAEFEAVSNGTYVRDSEESEDDEDTEDEDYEDEDE